jgi:uncharacterized protein
VRSNPKVTAEYQRWLGGTTAAPLELNFSAGMVQHGMPAAAIDDPILKRFRDALDALYGERVERVVLYGSRARGEAREDSDYDVAVFLHDLTDHWKEVDRIVEVETDILLDTGAVINAMAFPAGGYRERTGFMHEVRLDGIDL